MRPSTRSSGPAPWRRPALKALRRLPERPLRSARLLRSLEGLHTAVRERNRQRVAAEREPGLAIARLRRDRRLAGDVFHRPADVIDKAIAVHAVRAGVRASPALTVLIHRVGEREVPV